MIELWRQIDNELAAKRRRERYARDPEYRARRLSESREARNDSRRARYAANAEYRARRRAHAAEQYAKRKGG